MKRAILYMLCVCTDGLMLLVTAPYSLAAGVARVRYHSGIVEIHLKDGRLTRWRRMSTTLGHFVIVHPKHISPLTGETYPGVLRHELVHVEQCEGYAIAAWLFALAAWGHPLAVLVAGPVVPYFASGLAAWLRGETYYLGNAQEEAARG